MLKPKYLLGIFTLFIVGCSNTPPNINSSSLESSVLSSSETSTQESLEIPSESQGESVSVESVSSEKEVEMETTAVYTTLQYSQGQIKDSADYQVITEAIKRLKQEKQYFDTVSYIFVLKRDIEKEFIHIRIEEHHAGVNKLLMEYSIDSPTTRELNSQ